MSIRAWAVFFFFFQAEDGIRDHCVTGVQTCALPIFRGPESSGATPLGSGPRRSPSRMSAEHAGLGLFLVVGACLSSCGRADQGRSEAAKVLRALEVVRAAPNEAKRTPADELAHEPCSSPGVCDT